MLTSIKRALERFLTELDPKVEAHFVVSAVTFAVLHLGFPVPATVSAYSALVAGAAVAWLRKNAATDLRHQVVSLQARAIGHEKQIAALKAAAKPVAAVVPAKPKAKPRAKKAPRA